MGLESGTYLNDLNSANPTGSDVKSQGDNHLRLIKSVLQATFPSLAGEAWRVQSKSSTYTVLATDNMSVIRATAGITLDLTAAATLGNKHLFIALGDGGAITVDPNGAETINGSATITVADGAAAIIFCNGTSFHALHLPTSSALSAVVDDTSPQLGGDLDTNSNNITGAFSFTGTPTLSAKPIETAEGAAVASASSTDIWAGDDGNTVHVTGTATVTSFGTAPQAGAFRFVIFDGALTLTHNATSLILPGGANITTAAGDTCIVYADTTANMRVLAYQKANGEAVVSSGSGITQGTTLVQNPASLGTTATQAHGLGAEPSVAVVVFECLTAEAGFSVGERIVHSVSYFNEQSQSGYRVEWDATNVKMTPHFERLSLQFKSGNFLDPLTPANWKIEVYTYLYS